MLDDTLCFQAVANYVLYRTTNHLLHTGMGEGEARAAYVEKFMDQLLHEACRGDAGLRRCCQDSNPAGGIRRRAAEVAATSD